MEFIDAKFKDNDPKSTVKNIQDILNSLGIQTEEIHADSGVEGCHSVHVQMVGGLPGYNGKGVSKEFALASGYAEMIERLQSGIFLKSYQSIIRDPGMNFHSYAPDAKYMTVEELAENSEWMDDIISGYPDLMLTRESLAELCKVFACADDNRILTVPYYSLFEDKYVYLPAAFIDNMYSSNGICAGNTREEAWVHGLSEIMERYASQRVLMNGESAPRIPDEILSKFPLVHKIIHQVRESGKYDIEVFDYSIGNGFPIVSTRIISKEQQNYHVNTAADPVFEIAVQRTLTETFQGRSIKNIVCMHDGRVLNSVTDFPLINNVANQLYTSDGMYTADYFADELTCKKKAADFPDNSDKSNKELLEYTLELVRQLKKPVYVRNYSYLGFHSYQFIIPGFSETNPLRLGEIVPDYSLADSVRGVYQNVAKASDSDLNWMLNYSETTKNTFAKFEKFSYNSGIPIVGVSTAVLTSVTRAYAAYRLGRYADAIRYLKPATVNQKIPEEIRYYFRCINKYLEMKLDGITDEKIRVILYKFFESQYPDALYAKLDRDLSPYEDYILRCDLQSCKECRYHGDCRYHALKLLTQKVGEKYGAFTDGQNRDVFSLN